MWLLSLLSTFLNSKFMREIDTTFPTLHLNIQTITGFSAFLSRLFLHVWFKRLKE